MKIILLSSERDCSTGDLTVTIMLIFRDPSGYSLGRAKHTYYCNCQIQNTYGTFGRWAADCHSTVCHLQYKYVSSGDLSVTIMLIFRDHSGYSLGRSKHTYYWNAESRTNTVHSEDEQRTVTAQSVILGTFLDNFAAAINLEGSH